MKEFHLSVVASSRNDDHGGSLLYRMQHFVDGFVAQCNKHQLNAELILVEWNPPENKPPLSQALQFPKEKKYCEIRIIRVPKEAHATLLHSDNIPLFQMIAKNVGIRRARGKFVLVTNIDILFSDQLIKYLRDQLKQGFFYRVDRLDIPMEIPVNQSFEEVLEACKRSFFRINGRFGTKIKMDGKWVRERKIKRAASNCHILSRWIQSFTNVKRNLVVYFRNLEKVNRTPMYYVSMLLDFRFYQRQYRRIRVFFWIKSLGIAHQFRKVKFRVLFNLHTNACGDFTLLSREDWASQKGYPEWPIFSWHLDSIFLYQARFNGIRQRVLSQNLPIYHIEHGKGSGYTPEAADQLFKRLIDNNIPFIANDQFPLLIDQMHKITKQGQKIFYNDEKWGLIDFDLEEVTV